MPWEIDDLGIDLVVASFWDDPKCSIKIVTFFLFVFFENCERRLYLGRSFLVALGRLGGQGRRVRGRKGGMGEYNSWWIKTMIDHC